MEHVSADPSSIKSETADQAAPSKSDPKPKQRSRRKHNDVEDDPTKRRCVSSACVACRRRKSKCDGNQPSCNACAQVYGTECIYDPNSDHRRKGVYKHDADDPKTGSSTLQTLLTAIINLQEHEAFDLVREIRSCESLDAVAAEVSANEYGPGAVEDEGDGQEHDAGVSQSQMLEKQVYGKMAGLQLDDGSVRYIGGTSHLLHINEDQETDDADDYVQQEHPVTSWTRITTDPDLVIHLLNMYFTWHYSYFTTLSKTLFYRDFSLGYAPNTKRKTHYCTPLLVNAMLALGCHFTSRKGARENPNDSATAGDHFFKEAKRLILEGDLHEVPRLTTVQALALMSVREAGCAREAKGWVYSGMSFRMACDMGLNLNTGQLSRAKHTDGTEAEEDVRRVTFWGCFLFDKCWSNYLGRLPQLPMSIITAPKPEVFPDEDSAQWTPYSDSGFSQAHAQPARTRAVALQISKLCEISNDVMNYFYNPMDMEKSRAKSAELKMLSSIHTRLEAWRRDLPKEMEPREGGLSSVLTMHMFFQLLFIHLFRPFLKYTHATSPLPQTVSPRKLCTQAAQMISKLMRLYKRSHGLRQICNIAVYIVHSACTIHLLNLPDKNARRDVVHGVKHLEEIAEGWLCARRTLSILSMLARKWKVDLPEEAAAVLTRTDSKFGRYASDTPSPQRVPEMHQTKFAAPQTWPSQAQLTAATGYTEYNSNLTNGMSKAVPALKTPAQHYAAIPQKPPSNGVELRKPASPSHVFGGVEQLVRDGHDWVVRDQAQLANGFENWTGLEMDPSIWANDTMPMNGVVSGGAMNGGVSSAPLNPGMPISGAQVPMYQTNVTGYPIVDWGNGGFAYDNTVRYNTDDWYEV